MAVTYTHVPAPGRKCPFGSEIPDNFDSSTWKQKKQCSGRATKVLFIRKLLDRLQARQDARTHTHVICTDHHESQTMVGSWMLRTAPRLARVGVRWQTTLRYIAADPQAPREVPTPLLFVAAPKWTDGPSVEEYVMHTRV